MQNTKKQQAERMLIHSLGTLDFFKEKIFEEDSINFMLIEKIQDNLTEVYNYVQYGSREIHNN